MSTLKRIAGLDVGNRRIGVAVSDPLGVTAQPLCVISRTQLARDIGAVSEALAPYGVERFVIGLPVQLDGREGKQAEIVRRFGAALEKATGIPAAYQDERFTTIESERVLIDAGVSRVRRRTVVDKLAAVLILQSYLDGSKPPSASGGRD